MTTVEKKKRPVPHPVMENREQPEWKAVVEAAYGCLSWVDYSVDEYLREKRAETEREDRA